MSPGVFIRVGIGGKPATKFAMPEEVYHRGNDLISIHTASDDWPFRTQLCWTARRLSSVEGVLISITASLQTDLLDTRPVLEVAFPGSAGDAIQVSPTGLRFLQWEAQGADSPAIVAAPYPTDLPETSLHAAPDSCRFLLSPPFLEKGVIRRCRVGLLMMPPASGERETHRGLEEFAAIEVPLTA